MSSQFVEELEQFITGKLSTLDLIKEMPIGAVDRSEIVRRLKMALKNELEASEIAAVDHRSERIRHDRARHAGESTKLTRQLRS